MKRQTPTNSEATTEGFSASFKDMALVELQRRNWSYADIARLTGYAVQTVRKEFCVGFINKRFRARLTEVIGLGHGSK